MPLLLLVLLTVFTSWANDFCFPTHTLAVKFERRFSAQIAALQARLLAIQKPFTPSLVKLSRECNGCLVFYGDEYIKGVLMEDFNKHKDEFDLLLMEQKTKMKVDIIISDLEPEIKVGDKVIYNRLYKPFLRIPGIPENTIYDEEKNPIKIQASLLNEDVVEYKVEYKDLKHSFREHVGSRLFCLLPYTEENQKKYPLVLSGRENNFYILEDGKYLKLKHPGIKSLVRHFYYPQEQVSP